ncbi:MAG: hypothetical protein GOVbin4933_62 [Prokaryotic dsDNA virus sp.]|nr:MAG: hypothetical protein GOVbin4933_62 [Prokaryotic dsDNA virus sp.]|tara:strand:+ start:2339 stop:2803 length:465 start_codon:yes stop_codon:yes gene_type:complete
MVKTAEKNLWNRMREAMKVFRADIHYTRIENSVSDSYPDVEVSLLYQKVNYGATFELKTTSRPAHFETSVPVHVRPGQVRWLKKRWNVRGSAWLLVQVGSGKDLARYLIPGYLAGGVADGLPEAWFMQNSVCLPQDPLDRIVRIGCTWRWLDES